MNLYRTVLLIIFAILMLSACASTSLKTYATIDLNDRSIQIPLGPESVLGSIKEILIQNKFRVVVDDGGVRTSNEGQNSKLTVFQHSTRYRLHLRSRPTQIFCWSLKDEEIQYNLSIIDNTTGTEVMSLYGADCSSRILRRFAEALNLK